MQARRVSTKGAALVNQVVGLPQEEIRAQGPRLGSQLRINCLTFCQGLHHHHTGEDGGMFRALAGHHPELVPTLDRLHREHQAIAALLEELQQVVSAEDADPSRVLADVERLTAELEAHLSYEEEQLIPILDGQAGG